MCVDILLCLVHSFSLMLFSCFSFYSSSSSSSYFFSIFSLFSLFSVCVIFVEIYLLFFSKTEAINHMLVWLYEIVMQAAHDDSPIENGEGCFGPRFIGRGVRIHGKTGTAWVGEL